MANTTRTTTKHIRGLDGLSAVLQALPKEMRTAILAKGVAAGGRIVSTKAKRFARRSVDTGALYMSIGQVERKYPERATAVSVVGPEKDYFRGRTRLGKGDNRQGAAQPSRRAHLIEFGHWVKRKKGGPRLGWAAPRPFMRPAVESSGPEIHEAMTVAVGREVEATRRRLVRTGAHVA